MKRIIINIAMIIIAFTLQVSIFPCIPFLSASPNLILILVISYAFIYGTSQGLIYGLVAGILCDLFYRGSFGFFTLIYIWIGYINGRLTQFYYEDYLALPLALCIINELAYNLYIYLFAFFVRGQSAIGYYIVDIILPEMMITLVFMLIIYRIFLLYNKRLDDVASKRGIH